MIKAQEKKPSIWAIGGGKGGTGKTFIISQLAIQLASLGKQVILVDANFCAPNLHFFFGIREVEKSIIDFCEEEEILQNLIQKTRIKNLGIIPGDQNAFSCIDITNKKRTRLLKNLKKMNADYILLDVGSGSNPVTMDIFLEADKKIIVTDLEIISIDNLLHFLTNAILRRLNFPFNTYGLETTAPQLWKNRKQYKIKTIRDLTRHLSEISNMKENSVLKKLNHLQIHLIVNKVRKTNDIIEGFSVRSACIKYLGIETLYSGYVEYDNQLWKNFSLIPSEKFTMSPRIEQEVISIAENIDSDNQIKIDRIKNV